MSINLVQSKLSQISEARCSAMLIRSYIIRMIDYIYLLEKEITEKKQKIEELPRNTRDVNRIDISEGNNFTPDHSITSWRTIEKPTKITPDLYSKLGNLVASYLPNLRFFVNIHSFFVTYHKRNAEFEIMLNKHSVAFDTANRHLTACEKNFHDTNGLYFGRDPQNKSELLDQYNSFYNTMLWGLPQWLESLEQAKTVINKELLDNFDSYLKRTTGFTFASISVPET